MSTIAERVAAGAAFLDEREPGWWWVVDLDRLDLGSGCNCVLGQLHQSFGLGLVATDLVDGDDDIAMGFMWSGAHEFGDGEVEDLTAEWARVIIGRRPAS